MDTTIKKVIAEELKNIRENGLYKEERIILTKQGAIIAVKQGEVLNFCANNYLGLSSHPDLIAAVKKSLDAHGYGMSSVRFICGTQDIHKELEHSISQFLGTDDTILYGSCFDANAGLFETLLTDKDAVISDALNHASVIDGVRLCKAKRFIFKHKDMADLKIQLEAATKENTRIILIATDGVFSMDGDFANLKEICELAEHYSAVVMVDDSHATGFIGPTGRGTPEHFGVQDKVDIVTSTLGKALGGASGGFTSGRKEIVEFLRQRSRPYLFSNTLAPPIVAAGIKVFDILGTSDKLRKQLMENTKYFRERITQMGFTVKGEMHPICPIMLFDAKLAQDMAKDLLLEGIYVIGFSYPVVPKGEARIRVQISAAHTREQLDKALAAFEKIGKKHKVIQ